MWVDLFFNTFACIGLCAILKYGTILDFIRTPLKKFSFFKDLFSCAMCLGFWSGLVIGVVTGYNPILFPLYGSAICWASDYILDIIIKLGKQEAPKHSPELELINENNSED